MSVLYTDDGSTPTQSARSGVTMILAAELLAARYQMALSLGFHIILACFGVAFPAMIFVVHRRGIRLNDQDALALARRWSKASAVLFAVGAVSGTVLSVEMGLLWPGLMGTYGDVIGLPFAMEGIAFFTEAVFLGIYLYGWDRLPPRIHLWTLVPIMVSGLFGTFCIIAVNAWMNSPSGFTLDAEGTVSDIDPVAALFNDAVWGQFIHMWVAAYIVTGFVVAGVYAWALLRGRVDHHHRLGFRYPFLIAALFAIAQPFVGHITGTRLAEAQPSKLAAMELAAHTESRAPLTLGGVWIDGEARYGLEIPALGSLLATNSFDGVVPGLDEVPEDERPPVTIVHLAFQTMIALGTALAALAIWGLYVVSRRPEQQWPRLLLWAATLAGPAAVLALQTGWITTEVGRQPWIVYGAMRVEDAVTTNPGVWISLAVIVVLYSSMGYFAVRTLRRMAQRWRQDPTSSLPTPYGPSEERELVGS